MKSRESTNIDLLVGRRIRATRIKLGLTMDKVAEAINVTHQQVRKYEVGQNRISTGKLYEIAQFLKVTDINTFFNEEE